MKLKHFSGAAYAVAVGCVLTIAGCPDPVIELPELSDTAAVGTMAGSASVGHDGVFHYSMPIPIPPGRAGMQPSVSLAYSSTPSDSALGTGFQLAGLSGIARCGQSVAIDGQTVGVHLNDEDRLCLDGGRLIVPGTTPGGQPPTPYMTAPVYRTEVETWQRVEAVSVPSATSISGPEGFRVRMPDGRIREYGTTTDSRLIVQRSDGAFVVMQWLLAEERDTHSNVVQYRYEHIAPVVPPEILAAMRTPPPTRDIVRISRINYTGRRESESLVTGLTRSVRFTYASIAREIDFGTEPSGPSGEPGLVPPTGPEDAFFEGTYGWRASTYPLEEIQTYVGTSLVHEVRLRGEADPTSRRYRLSSVQQCANAPGPSAATDPGGLVCMPATRFQWRNRAVGVEVETDGRYGEPTFESVRPGVTPALVDLSRDCSAGGVCRDALPFLTLDADGDGSDDLLYLQNSAEGVGSVNLTLRFGGYAPRANLSFGPAEIPYRRSANVELPITDSPISRMLLESSQSIDWDLDGRDDLVFAEPMGISDERRRVTYRLRVFRSLGDGTFSETSSGLEFVGLLTPETGLGGIFHVLDMDGDGRRDVAVCTPIDAPRWRWGTLALLDSPGEWRVARRSADGWHPWTSSGARVDCLVEYARSLSAGQQTNRLDGSYYLRSTPVALDSDGDGQEELLIASQPFNNPATVANESQLASAAWRRLLRWSDETLTATPLTGVSMGAYIPVDLNGDGLHDLVGMHNAFGATNVVEDANTVVFVSTGDGFVRMGDEIDTPGRARVSTFPNGWDYGERFARAPLTVLGFDINADGRGDLLMGTLPIAQTRADLPACDANLFGTPFCERFNDPKYWSAEFLNSSRSVTYGTSIAPESERSYGVPGTPSSLGSRAPVMTVRSLVLDADGDGALDVLDVATVDAQNANRLVPRPRGTVLHHNIRAQPALIERILDGYNVETRVEYEPLSNRAVYTPSTDCSFPTRCVTDSRYVVHRLHRDAGLGVVGDRRATSVEQHTYVGGRNDLQGRGFLGFSFHRVRNPSTGETSETYFRNTSHWSAFKPSRVVHYRVQRDATIVGGQPSLRFQGTGTSNTWRQRLTADGTRFVVLESSSSASYEGMTAPADDASPFTSMTGVAGSFAQYEYDAYGNRTNSHVWQRSVGQTHAESTWINDVTRWRIGIPDTTHTTTIGDQGQGCTVDVQTSSYVDLASMELRRTDREGAGGVGFQATEYAYDSFGNLIRSTSFIDETTPERVATLEYPEDGYFPNAVENALGHRTDAYFDPRFGAVTETIDPNGVSTRRNLDGFGRVTNTMTEGRGSIALTYGLSNTVDGSHEVVLRASTGAQRRLSLDRLGRGVRQTTTRAFGQAISRREYDSEGRLRFETEPVLEITALETAPRTRYVYDNLGLRSTTSPDGEVSRTWMMPLRRFSQVVGSGISETRLADGGRVLAAVEPETGGVTSYAYCVSGALHRMADPEMNLTTIQYDSLGRRVFLADPAAGTASFELNGFDEITRTEDALGRVTRFERDSLGRLVDQFNDADAVQHHYDYDTALRPDGMPVLGALAGMWSSDGVSDTFAYDFESRNIGQSRWVDGRSLQFAYGLDANGRTETVTYPSQLSETPPTLRTSYGPSGDASTVTFNGEPIWELREQDGRGTPTHEDIGGTAGISRITEYTDGGKLANINTVRGMETFQDLAYDYSARGLLSTRTDSLAGRTTQYRHDQLGRLTRVSEGGVGASLATTERYTIDAIGNLDATLEGTLEYTDVAHPHAATLLRDRRTGAEETFVYDDVGNAVVAGALRITYTQANLPRQIIAANEFVHFTYDASGARATKRSGGLDITYFGLYEHERRGTANFERLSIPTPNGIIAQLEIRSGTLSDNPQPKPSTLRFLFSERQGTTESTWAAGETAQHIRYDSYGAVRTPSGALSTGLPTPLVNHGFTGHEHEDDLGIINMGGRIYHPRLRRFLTADPIVAVPAGQGLNAYSYVMGMPTGFTDPTGWQLVPSDYRPGPNGEQVTIVAGSTGAGGSTEPAGDSPAAETAGAGAAGVTQATDTEVAGPSRGQLGVDANGPVPMSAEATEAAFQAASERMQRNLAFPVMVTEGIAYFTGIMATGGIAEVGAAVWAVAETSSAVWLAAVRSIHFATQMADGVLAGEGGMLATGGIPALAGGAALASQSGVLDDVGRLASTGGGGGSVLARVQQAAAALPQQLRQLHQCHGFADALQDVLQASGIQGTRIQIEVGRGITIWSDSLRALGTQDMGHSAIQVGDMIFDNMRPQGIPAAQFFDDLGGAQFVGSSAVRITRTAF